MKIQRILGSIFTLALVSAVAISANAGTEILVTYYHNDALGSPVSATDEQGNELWREHYNAFGSRKDEDPRSTSNPRWFTGKTQDETGLVYLGARHYDPVVGRFMGRDPVAFLEDNPQSFNKYAYANNNPYRYVDPTGGVPVDWFIDGISISISAAIYANDPSIGNAIAFGADVILGIIPYVPSGIGILRSGDKLIDAAKTVDNVPKGTRSVDDLIKGSKLGGKTRGRTSQFDRSGGFNQANKDFDALGPKNVKDIDTAFGPGRTGTLPDGRQINVRPGSSNSGPPTLEIQQGKNRIKFRFNE